jgi:hypothetical protein
MICVAMKTMTMHALNFCYASYTQCFSAAKYSNYDFIVFQRAAN